MNLLKGAGAGVCALVAMAIWGQAAADAQGAGKIWTKPNRPAWEVVRQEQERLMMLRAQEPMVEIDVKDASIEEILDEFRTQGKISIDLNPANIPADELLTFKAKDAFSVVFELFLKKADLYVVEETDRYIRLARPHRVTYSFSDASIRSVIQIIAKEAGANIIIDPDVDGKITVTVHDVPWFEVLDNICKTLKVVVVREKYNVLRVIDRADLREQLETEIFTLRYLHPRDPYSASIKGNNQIAGAAMIPPKDIRTQVSDFPVLNIVRAAMNKEGGTGAGALIGAMEYDPGRNVLVVTDTRPVLDKIRDLIVRLDREPEQVIVEARFLTTTNTDLFHWGITWSNPATAFGTQPSFGAVAQSLNPGTVTATSPAGPGGGFTAGSINRLPFGLGSGHLAARWLNSYDINLILRMYREDRYSRFLQEPTLSVVDGEPATIFVGREIHFAEEVISTSGSGATATTTVSIKEATGSPINTGFTLFIIPKVIRGDDKVIMTIIPQFDRLSGTTGSNVGFNLFTTQAGATTRSIELPEISKSTLVTRLVMKSGTTVILGGLNEFTDTRTDQKIPFLGDIPVLGWLFKGTQQTQVSSHLLIFLTPHIVQPTDRAHDYLREAFASRAMEDRQNYNQFRNPDSLEEWRKRVDAERRKQLEEYENLKENGDSGR